MGSRVPSYEDLVGGNGYKEVKSYSDYLNGEKVAFPMHSVDPQPYGLVGEPLIRYDSERQVFIVEQPMVSFNGSSQKIEVSTKKGVIRITANNKTVTLSEKESERLINNGIENGDYVKVTYYTKVTEYKENKKDKIRKALVPLVSALGLIVILIPIFNKKCSLEYTGTGCVPNLEPTPTPEVPVEQMEKENYEEEVNAIIKEQYNAVINSMMPGIIIRGRADARDGINYDNKLLGSGKSYDEVVNKGVVDPGVEFLKKYNRLKDIKDPSLNDFLEAVKLLQDYYDMIDALKSDIGEHIGSNEAVVGAGLRGESYDKEKAVLAQQLVDVETLTNTVTKVLGQSNETLEIIQGLKEGRYKASMISNGIMISGINKNGEQFNTIIPISSLSLETEAPNMGGR